MVLLVGVTGRLDNVKQPQSILSLKQQYLRKHLKVYISQQKLKHQA